MINRSLFRPDKVAREIQFLYAIISLKNQDLFFSKPLTI